MHQYGMLNSDCWPNPANGSTSNKTCEAEYKIAAHFLYHILAQAPSVAAQANATDTHVSGLVEDALNNTKIDATVVVTNAKARTFKKPGCGQNYRFLKLPI